MVFPWVTPEGRRINSARPQGRTRPPDLPGADDPADTTRTETLYLGGDMALRDRAGDARADKRSESSW